MVSPPTGKKNAPQPQSHTDKQMKRMNALQLDKAKKQEQQQQPKIAKFHF